MSIFQRPTSLYFTNRRKKEKQIVVVVFKRTYTNSPMNRRLLNFFCLVKGMDVIEFREYTRLLFQVRVDWSTGLEIIALFFTFLSLVFYSAFVFKFGRS